MTALTPERQSEIILGILQRAPQQGVSSPSAVQNFTGLKRSRDESNEMLRSQHYPWTDSRKSEMVH